MVNSYSARVGRRGPRHYLRKGSALLIALGCVALLTLLVVSFLALAQTETQTSTQFSRGVSTKLLSDTAINLAISQIRQATKSLDSQTSAVVAWASQPGMIRTYDTSGNPVSFYKLYSSDIMVGTGQYNPATADDVADAGWFTETGSYVDLNQPINQIYPILNGGNLGTKLIDPVTGKSSFTYSTDGQNPDVEGFYVSNDTTQNPSLFASNPNPSDVVQMPVKWLYILADGSTVAPTQVTPGAQLVNVPGANSTTKKIVGRIAFWTDDETSKVNINTASEGNFWDLPLCDGRGERLLMANPPVKGEFNRMPGHPATVCLSSVFGNRFRTSNYPTQAFLDPVSGSSPANDATELSQIFGLNPRQSWGSVTKTTATGSQFASQPYPVTAEAGSSPAYFPYVTGSSSTSVTIPASAAITTNPYRLYATADELLYGPTANAATPPARVSNTPLQASDLQQTKFFITANSRAPEVTLFNTPRVSMWPITWPTGNFPSLTSSPALSTNPYYTNTNTNSSGFLTAEERLLAFCGTLGSTSGNPNVYYFQRQNANIVDAHDVAANLYNDNVSIPRNGNLLKYLDALTTQSIPGYGGNFDSKYGTGDRTETLTEMFDFIRSGVNLNTVYTNSGGTATVNYDYANQNYRTGSTQGGGSVVPITITRNGYTTQGVGHFSSLEEVSLNFYCAQRQAPDLTQLLGSNHFINFNISGTNEVKQQAEVGAQTTKIGMFMAFNFFNTMAGHIGSRNAFWVNVTGASGDFQINGQNCGMISSPGYTSLFDFSNVPYDNVHDDQTASDIWSSFGYNYPYTTGGIADKIYQKKVDTVNFASGTSPGVAYQSYPFYSSIITVNNTDTTFTFTGQPVVIKIYPLDYANLAPPSLKFKTETAVQTITIHFEKLNGTYPMPVAPFWSNNGGGGVAPPLVTDTTNNPHGITIPLQEIAMAQRPNAVLNSALTTPSGESNFVTSGPWDMTNLQARDYCTMTKANYDKSTGVYNNYLSIRDYNSTSTPPGYPYTVPIAQHSADTAVSMKLDPSPGTFGGDLRLLSLQNNIEYGLNGSNSGLPYFVPHYATTLLKNIIPPPVYAIADSINWGKNGPQYINVFECLFGFLTSGSQAWSGQNTLAVTAGGNSLGNFPTNLSLTPLAMNANGPGDFNNAYGNGSDGAVINKPNDTTATLGLDPLDSTWQCPFFTDYSYQNTQPFFSPAFQVSGPVMFGQLPSQAYSGVPWQNLLFNPNPAVGTSHKGFSSPPDHLLLDDFWMPVVEPYAISEPLSTAGKINLNYEIAPFSYISRRTGLYAAMKADRLTIISHGTGTSYKSVDSKCGEDPATNPLTTNTYDYKYPIDTDHTLVAFESKLTGSTSKLFIAPSEICSMFLIPKPNPVYSDATVTMPSPIANLNGDANAAVDNTTTMQNWWLGSNSSTQLTGANARQQPYAHLYPLLTTKSNTFQVHYRVQILTKSPSSSPAQYDESKGDAVASEARGSSIIERYVDPNDTTLPDFVTAFTAAGINTLDPYYKYRTVSSTAFAP